MKTLVKAMLYIMLLAGLGAAVFYLVTYINSERQNFYVSYGGEQLVGEAEVELDKDACSFFYPSDRSSDGFSVRIELSPLAIESLDGGYSVDGEMLFPDTSLDFSAAFDLHEKDGMVWIYLPDNLTVHEAFERIYPNRTVGWYADEIKVSDDYYFRLVFEDNRDKTAVYISFK